jgi:cysteinyl-tRNA synthetase
MASTGGEGYIDPSSLVVGLLDLRESARSGRDFTLADRIRDLLVDAGIEVMDSPDGTTWRIN